MRPSKAETAGTVLPLKTDHSQNLMQRIVTRVLPDGVQRTVYPFHVSLEGLESAVLCRDHEDYSTFVKQIAICALRKNVLIIIYAVVSNHAHIAILSCSQKEADNYALEVKRVYAQWFRHKYAEEGILRRTDTKAIYLDSDWYVRNALAYIPRNSMDNGVSVNEYLWSGYRAMFRQIPEHGEKAVTLLTKREKGALMHTGINLSTVSWTLDQNGDLIPGSFCDTAYLEQVFNHDPAFWMKTIGSLNTAEMKEKLVDAPRHMIPDSDFYLIVADVANRWFGLRIADLPLEKKLRLLPYLWRTRKTTVNQLARVLQLERNTVQKGIHPGKISVPGILGSDNTDSGQ